MSQTVSTTPVRAIEPIIRQPAVPIIATNPPAIVGPKILAKLNRPALSAIAVRSLSGPTSSLMIA